MMSDPHQAYTHSTLLLLPALNEGRNLRDLLPELSRSHATLLVIDDGSTDDTVQAATDHGAFVISLPFNTGVGPAVQCGIMWGLARGYQRFLRIDSDGQHSMDVVESLLEQLDEAEGLVIGSRFLSGTSSPSTQRTTALRRTGIFLVRTTLRLSSGTRVTDPTSGAVAFGKDLAVVYSRDYPDEYPEPEAIVLAKKHGFPVSEVPIVVRQRRHGSSTITLPKAIGYMLKVMISIGMMRRRS